MLFAVTRQVEGPGEHGIAAIWPLNQQLPAPAEPRHRRILGELCTEP